MMIQQSDDTQKQKRSPRRPWGCLRFLWIPLLIAVVCYGAMWVFARVGGEWAISDPFTVPPGSEEINITLADEIYGNDTLTYQLYLHNGTPDELRDWFKQQGFTFYPRCNEAHTVQGAAACYEDGPAHHGQKYVINTRLSLYRLSTFLTVIVPRVDTSNWQTIPVTNLIVSIYKDQAEFDKVRFYPDQNRSVPAIEIPQGKTAFRIITQTPREFEWWFFPPSQR